VAATAGAGSLLGHAAARLGVGGGQGIPAAPPAPGLFGMSMNQTMVVGAVAAVAAVYALKR
jgi:hypothetical protein